MTFPKGYYFDEINIIPCSKFQLACRFIPVKPQKLVQTLPQKKKGLTAEARQMLYNRYSSPALRGCGSISEK